MKKHALSTRIWHWINLICVTVLFMSGLNISNAHRYLYWGDYGFDPSTAWLSVIRFPGWATIPGDYSLADGRHWHFFFAWFFAFGLLFFMAFSLFNGHIRGMIAMRAAEWHPRALWRTIVDHARFDFHTAPGEAYNPLQKLSYIAVIFVMLPLMIVTGLAMSPGTDAALHFPSMMFGGRQTARSIHFIIAWSLIGFMLLHVALVIVHKPLTLLRGMTIGHRR